MGLSEKQSGPEPCWGYGGQGYDFHNSLPERTTKELLQNHFMYHDLAPLLKAHPLKCHPVAMQPHSRYHLSFMGLGRH